MGNQRFRFSNLLPNSWFYNSNTCNKLNNKITKTQPITTSSSSSSVSSVPSLQPATNQRKSYYFTRELTFHDPTLFQDPSPPRTPRRKSTKIKRPSALKKPVCRKLVSSELGPAACSCLESVEMETISTDSAFSNNEVMLHEQSVNCSCKATLLEEDVYAKVDLPRIITKTVKQDEFGSRKSVMDGGSRSLSVRVVKEDIIRSPVKKAKGNGYSPRLGNRVRVNGISGGRRRNRNPRSLSESLAVVKTSVDPGRDFKESMVEMIMENNIKSSKDLEDLLTCYLALNSDEYHDLIIKVFKQIWFECTDIRL